MRTRDIMPCIKANIEEWLTDGITENIVIFVNKKKRGGAEVQIIGLPQKVEGKGVSTYE